jgi:hypothetical protein
MVDLRERFTAADDLPAPDLWPAVEARLQPAPEAGRDLVHRKLDLPRIRSPRRELVAVALILAVLAGGMVWLVQRADRPDRLPATPVPSGIFDRVHGWIAYPLHDVWALDPANPGIEDRVRLTSRGGMPNGGDFVAWSSHGNHLLYDDYTESGKHVPLIVLDADGIEHRLTVGRAGSFAGASIAPDGMRIVVATGGEGGTRSAIESVPVDGGPTRVLREAAMGTLLMSPALSPDGSRIAFEEIGPDGISRIWVMRSDGSAAGIIFSGRTNGDEVSDLAWSPDGTRLAFAGAAEGSAGGITVMGADGSNPDVRVGGPAWSPTWSPDGSTIAYGRDTVVCLVHANAPGNWCLPVIIPRRYWMIAWNPGR